MRYNTKSYPNRERNDCGVRALAAAAGVTYTKAYKALAIAGRQKKRGSFLSRWIRYGRIPGFRFEQLFDREIYVGYSHDDYGVCMRPHVPLTLKQFIKKYPTGNYLACSHNHAFAVRNSVVIDANRPGARVRVQQAWKVVAV